MIKYEEDSDDELGGPGYKTPLMRKHPPLPWRNGLVDNSTEKTTNVIEISDSSSSESSDSDFETPKKKRKLNSTGASSRSRIFSFTELDAETQEAKSAESQSILQRIEKNNFLSNGQKSSANETVLDVVEGVKNGKIVIHSELNKLLKPHQVDGIKHMYQCCYGSVNGRITAHPKIGSGCILAHCMGMGKTLQLIALLHTVINYPEFGTNRILILCPKSTLSNWKAEINKWIGSIRQTRRLKVFEFSESRSKDQQLDKLDTWSKFNQKSEHAGCFLISYESFRSLVFYGQTSRKKPKMGAKRTTTNLNTFSTAKAARVQGIVRRTLLTATDLIVCDEGHMIKNLGSVINQAVRQLETPRRIVLTGTPMQNNLMEYYAMVNFVKPLILGTPKEFRNMYATPIEKGQHRDSTSTEIRLMRMQAFNLNNELESFVHRREVSFLMKELPEKFEYVLYIPMSDTQVNLYEYYLAENPYSFNSKKLFADYTALRKIWTHPKQLEVSFDKAVKRKTNVVAVAASNAESRPSEANDEFDDSENPTTSINRDWWKPFITDDELNSLLLSPKFEVMLEILKQAERRSEKCLIFSTSVVCLNIVEFFLKQNGSWRPERDYYRLDGPTKNFQRNRMIVEFNNPQNTRVKAFLISAKAGGQGINLTAANRIILLDTSWNPSVDQQSIFRIFRFGQTKKCYVYRLLAMGTMEEKIFSRSVTKQAMSIRVVDKQQIDRNYSTAELAELYTNNNKKIIVISNIQIKPPNHDQKTHSTETEGIGIKNYGNTCYINSVLQAIFHVPTIVDWLMESCEDVNFETVSGQLFYLLCSTRLGSGSDVEWVIEALRDKPKELYRGKYIPSFPPNVQMDCYNFLSSLLDSVQEESSHQFKNLFTYKFQNYHHCHHCECESITVNEATALTLTLEANTSVQHIEKLLADELNGTNMDTDSRSCTLCKVVSKYHNIITLTTAPPILIIHLKRFHTNNKNLNVKNNAKVLLQSDITIRVTDNEETIAVRYELKAIVLHVGNLISGHYTTVVKMNEWIMYDDDKKIVKVQFDSIDFRQPYVIFYEKTESKVRIDRNDEIKKVGGDSSRVTQNVNGYPVLFSDDEQIEPPDDEPFRRQASFRSTPINIKKKISTKSNAPSPVDQLAAVKLTQLRHKAPAGRSNARTFTPEEEIRLQERINEYRRNRKSLPPNGLRKLGDFVKKSFGKDVELNTISNWMYHSSRRGNNVSKIAIPLTGDEKTALYDIFENSSDWKDIYETFKTKYPQARHKLSSLKAIIYRERCMPDVTYANWSDGEIDVLKDHVRSHGFNCHIKLPQRNASQIRSKIRTIWHKQIRDNGCPPFSQMLTEAFFIVANREDSGVVHKEEWISTLFEMNRNVPEVIILYVFNITLKQLLKDGRIVQINSDEEYIVGQNLPRLEGSTFFREILEHELDHLRAEAERCQTESAKNYEFTWFGSKSINLFATTTYEGPRHIAFQSSNSIFDDATVDDLLHNDASIENDDDDDDNLLVSSRRGKKLHVFGAIRFLGTEKSLFFFTAERDIFTYIGRQIQYVFARKNCPSWFDALIQHMHKIDYENIKILAVAESYLAAMRLKLSTVAICATSCFNVRTTKFTPILDGRTDYMELLDSNDINVDKFKSDQMIDDMGPQSE